MSSKRKRLTDKWLKGYAPEATQEDWWDELVTDFGVRFSSGGAKTFQVRYRTQGVRKRAKLGRYPAMSLADAREAARLRLANVDAGTEVHDDRDDSFGALVDTALRYVEDRTRPKTMANYRSILASELLPAVHQKRKGEPKVRRAGWKNRPAGSITRSDVREVHNAIHRRGSTRWANEMLKVAHLIFNIGLDEEFPGLEYNPASRIKKFPEKPKRENPDRYLSREEIAKLWTVLEGENLMSAGIMKLTLLTTQRVGAVQMMRWPDLDLEMQEWTLRGVDGEKLNRRWTVPLSDAAVTVLRELQMVSGGGEYVFPSRAGARKPHINSILSMVARIRAAVGAGHWVTHDLRTTFRTHATRSKTPRRGPAGLGIDADLADLCESRIADSVGFRSYQGDKHRFRIDDRADALDAWALFVLDCASEQQPSA